MENRGLIVGKPYLGITSRLSAMSSKLNLDSHSPLNQGLGFAST